MISTLNTAAAIQTLLDVALSHCASINQPIAARIGNVVNTFEPLYPLLLINAEGSQILNLNTQYGLSLNALLIMGPKDDTQSQALSVQAAALYQELATAYHSYKSAIIRVSSATSVSEHSMASRPNQNSHLIGLSFGVCLGVKANESF